MGDRLVTFASWIYELKTRDMSKRLNNENNYPFYWLDELAEITLNPEKNDLDNLKPPELAAIAERLPEEFSRISACLKNQAFCLYAGDQLKVVAGHYDQAIRLLQQQVHLNLAQYPARGPLRELGQQLLDSLQELSQSVHQRYQAYLTEPPPGSPETQTQPKITCRLSVDQIAILLKAADETQLVSSRSFSQVLKSITPFLSTERYHDFSWKSARSSTYKMEDNDKAVAIHTLEAMINKIKEY
jgi:hypothetical protein